MGDVWKRVPVLKKCLDEGVIKCFKDKMVTCDLTDEHKEKIKWFEEENKEYGLKVFAVIEQTSSAIGILMTCYVYLDEIKPWDIGDGVTGFMAYVVNKDWGLEEHGSIGVMQPARVTTGSAGILVEKLPWIARVM